MNQQLYILLILLFFSKGLFGQTTDNDAWEGHFSYTKIKAVVDGGDKIYAASENAIFSYEPITEERETITTINGTANQVDVTGTTISLSSTIQCPGDLTVSNGNFTLPVGTTAERPVSPVIGMMRINTDL